HLQGNFGDAVGKDNVGAIFLVGFGSPFIGDGLATWLEGELAIDFGRGAFGGLQLRCAGSNPAAFGLRNLKLLASDGFAVEKNIQFSLVLLEDAALFLVGERRGGAE